MKHKLLLLFIIVACSILVFQSCKQNEEHLALFVPKDATSVIVVDTKAITDKISSSGITIDSLANLFNKRDGGLNWNDIENSGINLQKPCIIFSKETNSVQSGKTSNSGFIAEVQDKSKIENFFKKQLANAVVKADKNYQYIELSDGYIAGWNDKVLIISGVKNGENNNSDDILAQQQLTALFAQTESNSIASMSEFNDMLKKKGDIHFWSNASGNLTALPMMGMTKIGDLFQDTYVDGTIDFDNGKIVASSTSHINKTLSDMLDKYPSKTIDKDMITNYPGDVSGFGIVSFNPKVLMDILHYLGFDMMANSYASQLGFDLNDVMNAFSGDIAFIASNLFAKKDMLSGADSMNASKNSGYLLNLRIGDKAAFDKVMTALTNKNILSKNGDEYQLGAEGGHDFIIETTDKSLLIGSSDQLIKAYESGNSKASLPGDIDKKLNDKSMAFYADINSMFKNSDIKDSSSKTFNLAKQTFKNFIATTDKSNDKTITGSFELNFVNTNENSLASFAKFAAVAHKEDMDRKQDKTSNFMNDSIPPPPEPNDSDESPK